LHYKNENDLRAARDISDIKVNLENLESRLASAKEIEQKKEFKKILEEREVLKAAEKDLYQ